MDPAEIKKLLDEYEDLMRQTHRLKVAIEFKKAKLDPLEDRLHEVRIALINEYDRRKA